VTGQTRFLEELSMLLKVSDLSSIDPDANLFDLGLLDSFGIVALAELLYKHSLTNREVDIEDLVKIDSINKLRSFID
jgi:aryl carrier-like protein